jgi:hypothetical protein
LSIVKEAIMAFFRTAIGVSALVAALATTLVGAVAHDETKYPDK